MRKVICSSFVCLLLTVGFGTSPAVAQEPREIKCGDTLDLEFLKMPRHNILGFVYLHAPFCEPLEAQWGIRWNFG
jgi:hypothetical protein